MVGTIARGRARLRAPIVGLARALRGRPLMGIAFGLAIAILVYAAFDVPASNAARALDAEFSHVGVPPAAELLSRYSGHKPGQAVVGAKYRAAISYDTLRSFYDAELEPRGWQRVSESLLTNWGADFGGRMACYRRAEYWAALQYLGDVTVPPTYAIDLIWGSSLCAAAD